VQFAQGEKVVDVEAGATAPVELTVS
jgi:hypothetical protein